MKVLDATFLIDYLNGEQTAVEYLKVNRDEEFVIPLPAYAEAVVGEGNKPKRSDIDGVRNALNWGDVYTTEERHAVVGAEIADEIGAGGPYIDGCDALVAAVGRELDAPVVSDDRDLTHPETKKVIDVEEYR